MTNIKQAVFALEPIILASGSPRRSEILDAVGWNFQKDVPDVDESVVDGEGPGEYVERLAIKKARAVASRHENKIVLGADTTVVVDGRIVAKPLDEEDAFRMISSLSGRDHTVLTGIALVRGDQVLSGIEETKVSFNAISNSEVEFLVKEGSPMDKAGGYAVQAQAALFIDRIEGDYWNVVGLPISLVYRKYQEIKKSGE